MAARRPDAAIVAATELLARRTTAFDHAPIGILLLDADPQRRLLAANPALCRLLGYSEDELRELGVAEVTHPDDLAADLELAHELRRGERHSYVLEQRFVRRDGSLVWTTLTVCAVDDPASGRRALGFVEDRSESRRTEQLRASEERFRSLAHNSYDFLTIFDRSMTPSYVSPSHEHRLGHPLDELEERSRPDLVHPDDLEALSDVLRDAAQEPGSTRAVTYRFRHADGGWHHLEATVTNLLDNPAVRGIVLNARDVTERVEAVEALRRSEARFESLIRNSTDVVAVVARRGAVRYVSPASEEVLGYTPAEVFDLGLPLPVHPDDAPVWPRNLAEVTQRPRARATFELRFRHGGGDWRWIEVSALNLHDDPAVDGVVVHMRDVTDRRRAEDDLAHQALHDDLTGLPNRALVVDRLARALARATRTGMRCAVLFLDLDRFKLVNDSLGHSQGDALLVEVARRLARSIRSTDTVARLGGDEFLVLLEDVADAAAATHAAETVAETLRRPFRIGDRELYATASIGFALSEGGSTADTLIRDADAAMYQAKARGRNRVDVFDASIRRQVVQRLELEHDLHRALHQGTLRLEYQPAFALDTMRVNGVEALLRWQHPRRGAVAAEDLVRVAEESGLIVAVGDWVLDTACRQAAAWRDDLGERAPTMWVNVSARQLARADLDETVAHLLATYDLPPAALGLELTESALVEEAESTGTELHELRDLGVKLAIDDFGTGYSSLAYLRRFAVDLLKLDRAFVHGLGASLDDGAIASAVIGLGHSLGTSVTAEGVETPEQLRRLRSLGCDSVCGFLLARPAPAAQLGDLLRDGLAA